MIINREELAFAGGLYEGEGSMGYRRGKQQIQVQVGMADREPLERFGAAVGLGRLYGPYVAVRNGKTHLPQWRWYINTYEKVQAVVAMLWPWLGPRRRKQANEVLKRALMPRIPFRHTPETKAKITGRPKLKRKDFP